MNAKLLHPVVAIIAGVSVLVFPQVLNFIVGIYLIVTGILSLPSRV